ncbi:MAG: sulfotransferase [Nevskia sp.]|nr:sulfotransferase [Nevskia sp.]
MNRARTAAFDPQALLEEARAANDGLTDFGDPSFRAGLDVLCRALDGQAQLSATGTALMRQKLVTQLGNRLRVEDWFARHPEIAREEIAPPLVIVGLPRTGTTKLHRLLSRDPRFWWMAFWESQFPVPFTDESLERPIARIAAGHELCAMMTQAMPRLLAIHPMDAEEADEEVMLMEHSFLSAFNAYADVPDYERWLETQDQAPAYRYLRRMLQFLQWQKRHRGIEAQRWLLKAPHHLLRMDVLLRVFPGAQVILTHREPEECVPSLASFIHTLWRIYSERADPQRAGRSWSALMRRALEHTLRVRDRPEFAGQFLDVEFRDTISCPMEVAERIYRFIGWPLPDSTRAAMRSWLAQDEKTHVGGHDYRAQDYGLSQEQLRRDFAAYRARHFARSA